jgi:hypothetical protein
MAVIDQPLPFDSLNLDSVLPLVGEQQLITFVGSCAEVLAVLNRRVSGFDGVEISPMVVEALDQVWKVAGGHDRTEIRAEDVLGQMPNEQDSPWSPTSAVSSAATSAVAYALATLEARTGAQQIESATSCAFQLYDTAEFYVQECYPGRVATGEWVMDPRITWGVQWISESLRAGAHESLTSIRALAREQGEVYAAMFDLEALVSMGPRKSG